MKKTLFLTLALCAIILAGCDDGGGNADKVTIVFDTDGGPPVPSVTLDIGGKLPASYFRTGIDVPIRDGYRFKGWLLNGTAVSTGKTFIRNATLKADWARRITVSFTLGNLALGYPAKGTAPAPVTIDEGAGLGSKYPTLPSQKEFIVNIEDGVDLSGEKEFEFDGWFDGTASTATRYTATTPVTTAANRVAMIARWVTKEVYIPENAYTPAIHPGSHFSEVYPSGINAQTGVVFHVEGLNAQTNDDGVLSAKWYRALSEADAIANVAMPNTPISEYSAEGNEKTTELSLQLDWTENTAGTYWYWVEVTNFNAKATVNKTKVIRTQNNLKVIVSD